MTDRDDTSEELAQELQSGTALLGIMVKGGLTNTFPPNAILVFVVPDKEGGAPTAIPMGLDRIDVSANRVPTKLRTRCPCGHPACTRRMVAELKWKGEHPDSIPVASPQGGVKA